MAEIHARRSTNCHGAPNGSNRNHRGSASRNVTQTQALATHRMTSIRRRSTKRSATAPTSGAKRISDSTGTASITPDTLRKPADGAHGAIDDLINHVLLDHMCHPAGNLHRPSAAVHDGTDDAVVEPRQTACRRENAAHQRRRVQLVEVVLI